MNRWWLSAVGIVFCVTSGFAKVVPSEGQRNEKFGAAWERVDLKTWLTRGDSVVTPELTNLAVQACLRSQQESFDVEASTLVMGMGKTFATQLSNTRATYEKGLSVLGALMHRLENIQAESATDYSSKCDLVVKEEFAARGEYLTPLYHGRFFPKTLPEFGKAGIQIAPLTWEGLREQICKLEGYYSTSQRPELWKFFAITRAMGNVLPSEESDGEFVAVLANFPDLRERIVKLSAYSSVAGKVNGPAIGYDVENVAPRLTGPGMGSKATSMLAFFTTGWRERIQKLVLERPYPEQAFELLRSDELVNAIKVMRPTYCGSERCSDLKSASELGMTSLWYALSPVLWAIRTESGSAYTYLKTSALAWLAVNAEANIRVNEKISGVKAAAIEPDAITDLVYGAPNSYREITLSIAAAQKAYAVIDPSGQKASPCLSELKTYTEAAAKVQDGSVGRVTGASREQLAHVQLEPVIADIGLEVDDSQDGAFKLHLATGGGRATPMTIQGSQFSWWTPSAHILHLPGAVSTAQWRNKMVDEFDR